jgi:hypothetical protein
MKKINMSLLPAITLAAGILSPTPLQGVERPEIVNTTPSLPAIWQKVSTRDRMNLVRVAELDAVRLLTERINGVQIDSETSVRDLTDSDDRITAELRSYISGVKSVDRPRFLDDGRVEVVKKVDLEQIIAKLEETYSRREDGPLKSTSKQTMTSRDVTFEIMGSSAIKGSEGHKRILSKRAAEVDAARRLAERLGNLKINSSTTVADLVTEDDSIKASITRVVKNAETIKIRFIADGSAEVTLRVKLEPLVRVISRKFQGNDITLLSDETKQLIFEETGVGVAPEDLGIQVDVTIESVVEQTLSDKGDRP